MGKKLQNRKICIRDIFLIVGIALFLYTGCSTQYKFHEFFYFWSKKESSQEQMKSLQTKSLQEGKTISNFNSKPVNTAEAKTSPVVKKESTEKMIERIIKEKPTATVVKAKENTTSNVSNNQRPISESKVTSEQTPIKPKKREVMVAQVLPEEKVNDITIGINGGKQKTNKRKQVFPCNPIYLSARGVCAGTGDPEGFAGDANKEGKTEHPLALELSGLPEDQYGFTDWAESIRQGLITPKNSIDPNPKKRKRAERKKSLDLNIVIRSKSRFQPDVLFPHNIHTTWLNCHTCHPKIFKREAGGNPSMTMPKIAAGEYCGRCHNRVAFPLSDCLRCHTVPKEF